MRRLVVRAAVLVTLLGLGVPVGASGDGPGTGGRAAAPPRSSQGYWSRYAAAEPGDRDAVWRDSVAAVVRERRPFLEIGGHAEDSLTFRGVSLAGDLDGDRRDDVVQIAQTLAGKSHVLDRVEVEAYQGATGRQLWKTETRLPEIECRNGDCRPNFTMSWAFLAPVGSQGQGIMFVSAREISDRTDVGGPLGPTGPLWDTVSAIDLAQFDGRGRLLWSRHVEGRRHRQTGPPADRLERFAVLHGVGDIEPGREVDWLLTVEDGVVVHTDDGPVTVSDPAPSGVAYEVRTVVVDGRTGGLREVGAPVRGSAPERRRDVRVIGDVTGDRRDDVAYVPSYAYEPSADAAVVVRSGADGSRVWQVATGGRNAGLGHAGDLTGDGRHDLLLYLDRPSSKQEPHAPRPPATLLDGATGRPLWQKAFDSYLRTADVNRDGRADLLVSRTVKGRAGYVTADVVAYDGAGRQLYSSRVAARDADAEHLVDTYLSPVGDIDGDRVGDAELYALIVIESSETPGGGKSTFRFTRFAVVSGARGRPLSLPPLAEPMFGSLDGRGDDVTVSGKTGVTVHDGRTARPLWQVGFGRPVGYASAETGSTDGDRCRDLLAYAYFGSPRDASIVVTVLSGATGKPAWTRRFGPEIAATGATTAKPHRCAG